MATTISQTHIDLPGAEGHRFRLFERKHRPVEGGAGALAGDKQLISHRVIDDADHWDSRILERN